MKFIQAHSKTPMSGLEKQSADKTRIIDSKCVPMSRLWVYLKASSWQMMGQYLLFPLYYLERQCLLCFAAMVWPEGHHAKHFQHTRIFSMGVGSTEIPVITSNMKIAGHSCRTQTSDGHHCSILVDFLGNSGSCMGSISSCGASHCSVCVLQFSG